MLGVMGKHDYMVGGLESLLLGGKIGDEIGLLYRFICHDMKNLFRVLLGKGLYGESFRLYHMLSP